MKHTTVLLLIIIIGGAGIGVFHLGEPANSQSSNTSINAPPPIASSINHSSKPNEPITYVTQAPPQPIHSPFNGKSPSLRDPGSEGYGPHIAEILATGSATEAADALYQLIGCEYNDKSLNFMIGARADVIDAKARANLTKGIEYQQLVQRRCQSVTADIAALQPRLRMKAALGGVVGMADSCLVDKACVAGITDEQRQQLQGYLKEDAQRGDLGSIETLALGFVNMDLAPDERRAYVLAYRAIRQESVTGNVMQKADPTGALQQAVAERLAVDTPTAGSTQQLARAIEEAYWKRKRELAR